MSNELTRDESWVIGELYKIASDTRLGAEGAGWSSNYLEHTIASWEVLQGLVHKGYLKYDAFSRSFEFTPKAIRFAKKTFRNPDSTRRMATTYMVDMARPWGPYYWQRIAARGPKEAATIYAKRKGMSLDQSVLVWTEADFDMPGHAYDNISYDYEARELLEQRNPTKKPWPEYKVHHSKPDYGVFVWNRDGRYLPSDAIHIYKRESSAEAFVEKMKGYDLGYVVRPLY